MGKVKAEKRYRNRHNPLNSNGKRCINTEEIYYAPDRVAGGPSPFTSSGKEKAPIVIGKVLMSISSCSCVKTVISVSFHSWQVVTQLIRSMLVGVWPTLYSPQSTSDISSSAEL